MKEECQQEVFYMEGDEGKHFCSMHVGQHLSMYEISYMEECQQEVNEGRVSTRSILYGRG